MQIKKHKIHKKVIGWKIKNIASELYKPSKNINDQCLKYVVTL